MVRSISNPDLLAAETIDLTSSPTSNGCLLGNRGDHVSTSSAESPPTTGMVVTYSEDTTEAAAEAMEEFLLRPTSSSVSVPFRSLAAMLGGFRGKRKVKSKKGSKHVSSVDDSSVTSESQSRGTSPSSPLGGRESRSNHSSPQLNRKGNHSGVFRRPKGSQLSHLRPHDPNNTGEGAEVKRGKSETDSLEDHTRSGSADNLHETEKSRKKKKHHTSLNVEQHLQPRLQISSPLKRDWSGSELRNEELQSLILPPPASWTKSGYLWLRMHTENRYAWTHIVSAVCVVCVQVCVGGINSVFCFHVGGSPLNM